MFLPELLYIEIDHTRLPFAADLHADCRFGDCAISWTSVCYWGLICDSKMAKRIVRRLLLWLSFANCVHKVHHRTLKCGGRFIVEDRRQRADGPLYVWSDGVYSRAASTLPLSGRDGVSASCETLGNAAPVEKTSYHRFDVVSSAVLPVEIVGVFPDIDNPKWCDSCAGDGSLGIWRAHDG